MKADLEPHIKVTDWLRPADQDIEVVRVLLMLKLTATNGRHLMGQFSSYAVISQRERAANAGRDLALKQSKLVQAKLALLEYVEVKLSQRTGLAGYRGYFKLKHAGVYE